MEEFENILLLIEEKKFVQVRDLIREMNIVDVAELITTMEEDHRAIILFRLLPKEMAAEVFAYLDSDLQLMIVEKISDKELTEIISELYLDDTVDFIEEMPASIVKRVIKNADAVTRKHINQLLQYPEESAGSLMTIEFMELKSGWTVQKSIAEVRKKCEDKESIAVLFVTDHARKLEGTIELQNILAGKDDELIGDLMETDVISVFTHENQEEVADTFKKYDQVALPVVDTENRLVGMITIDDVVDVIEEETTEDIYKMAAMEPMEETYMDASPFTLARKRILWLMILMISATFTGMIITHYESSLVANSLVFLTAYIPMLMDTGGNSGSQASVSIIRGITLGEVEFRHIFKVMWKEFRVSLMVGLGVAVLNFARILLTNLITPVDGNIYLIATVVSLTLFVTVIIAKLIGCTLPLIATKLKLDPALMASPMITTIVDALALLVYFSIAGVFFQF